MKPELRKSLLASIHIGKKEIGMEDDSYRALLARHANGKISAADLSVDELKLVLDEMRLKGFKPHPGKATTKNYGKRPNPTQNRQALMGKVEALLADAGRPWSYAHHMAQGMFKIERVDWLNGHQLWKLVAALEYDARRHGRGTHAASIPHH